MAEKIMIIITFLAIVFFVGTFIWVENRMTVIENTVTLELERISEVEKKQRITSQDVKFLEDLIIEKE